MKDPSTNRMCIQIKGSISTFTQDKNYCIHEVAIKHEFLQANLGNSCKSYHILKMLISHISNFTQAFDWIETSVMTATAVGS